MVQNPAISGSAVGPDAAGSRAAEAPAAAQRLRLLAWATLMALVAQFLLGTATSLYVTVPHRHPWTASHPAVVLWAHIVVGVALIGNAFMVLGRARAGGSPAVLGWALAGLLGIVGAAAAGAGFVGAGGSTGASMGMAVGFAVAVVSYAVVLWQTPR